MDILAYLSNGDYVAPPNNPTHRDVKRFDMKNTTKKLSKKLAILGAMGVALTFATPTAAFANYSTQVIDGQFVGKDGLNCGGQEILGVSGAFGSVQHAWVYYNCSSGSLRRYADIANDWDGDCYGIGPGQARVLDAKWSWANNVYNGSKAC